MYKTLGNLRAFFLVRGSWRGLFSHSTTLMFFHPEIQSLCVCVCVRGVIGVVNSIKTYLSPWSRPTHTTGVSCHAHTTYTPMHTQHLSPSPSGISQWANPSWEEEEVKVNGGREGEDVEPPITVMDEGEDAGWWLLPLPVPHGCEPAGTTNLHRDGMVGVVEASGTRREMRREKGGRGLSARLILFV